MSEPASELTPAQTQALMREGATLVDVREPYEREAGFIAPSVHIELAQLSGRAASIDRERPVIFYCRVGARSAMAASAFAAAGYDAHTMGGGILAWEAAGLPLTPDGAHVAAH